MTCPKCTEDERRVDEDTRQRVDIVARYCVKESVPSRCSRSSSRETDLVEAYYTLYPQGHYFDDDTMRFFDSRIGLHVRTERGYLFVTSEKGPSGVRMWSVRLMPMDYKQVRQGVMIEEVSEFQEYGSRGGANRRLEREAKGGA